MLINEAVQGGANLDKACTTAGITERTYYRWQKRYQQTGKYDDLRKNAVRLRPSFALGEDERQGILDLMNSAEFASMPPCEIVPTLADRGEYLASESTFYRILRENKMARRRGRARTPQKRKPTTHKATAPNQVWMWDITYLKGPIKGTFYYLYMIIDLFSRDIVGWEVWEKESGEHARDLILRAVLGQRLLSTEPLVLHSDNGSPMKAATMLATLQTLGITPSNSRPRVSNDNPYAESIFKTLKYRPNFKVDGFMSLEDARLWCADFVRWYRTEHHHSGLKFVTPAQRHNGSSEAIMDRRRAVYEQAKASNPHRWKTRAVRNWSLPTEVYLNPEKECQKKENSTLN